jgi:hypothetical protein
MALSRTRAGGTAARSLLVAHTTASGMNKGATSARRAWCWTVEILKNQGELSMGDSEGYQLKKMVR